MVNRLAARRIPSLFLLLTLLTAPAAGDDWPQFRYNAARTAASRDGLSFPLVPIWEWESASNTFSMSSCAIWKGRVLFIDGGFDPVTARRRRASGRALVCADARTGQSIWNRPLMDHWWGGWDGW